ncbi:related to CBP3 - mitochondrial protein required for assembly of cytochrome bc1 complex [Pseudozyma flocculosa]|uniref:Related to CBP3 - mitochondrial protein required for assembly of cytochrome bc1 complex n=1 Tax=Pseudozyma flocculosa TaxID=84751 RepID=A0A5C3FCQ8_9BASI|nr:related to CBP3 - mitochondrial protein required for assembly of cytochrome bc1 complex [Pseudozyma flocculosa]
MTRLASSSASSQALGALVHLRPSATTAARLATSARSTDASRPAPRSNPSKTPASHTAPLLHRSQLSPSAPPALPKKSYSPFTVSVVKGLAKLMGYNSLSSTAIRVTSDLYDRCAERAHVERNFWYGDCALPQTYQTWFQITNLHIYLLLVRFRALPRDEARTYSQELINHFFIDAESRMRDRFGVQTSRLVKGYMRDMHQQHRGSILSFDEGLVGGDVRMAQALWRNIWGAGWGTVAGVKRKLKGIDKLAEGEKESEAERGMPDLARDVTLQDPTLATKMAASPYAKAAAAQRAAEMAGATPSSLGGPDTRDRGLAHTAAGSIDTLPATDAMAAAHPELAYALHLHRLVAFVRAETSRLASLSDREIMLGRLDLKTPGQVGRSSRSEEAANASKSIASFQRL